MFKTKSHVAHKIPICQDSDFDGEQHDQRLVATSERRNHLVRYA